MKAIILFFLVLGSQVIFSQASQINAYEYVIVPMQFKFQNEPNQHQINILSRVLLKEEGFKVYMDSEDRPLAYRGNTCEPLFLDIENTSSYLTIKVIVRLKDCYDNVLFESEEGTTKLKDFREGYQEAVTMAFESLSEMNYQYDPSLDKAESRTKLLKKTSSGNSEEIEEAYPDKKLFILDGEQYWMIKNGPKDFILLANQGKERFAELNNADKGTFIFNSKTISGAAYFDSDGNLNVEFMDEDSGQIKEHIYLKVNQ